MPNKATTCLPWFFVVNIFTNIIANCQIILGLIFILIILCNRAYQSVSNCLTVNTVFSIKLYAISIVSISIRMWQCDNHPDPCIEDSRCFFRNYINDVAMTAAVYSLTVQSIHRLITAIFVHNARLQMFHSRLILCIIQWLIALLFPAYFTYLDPQLQYDPVNYICVISEKTSTFLSIFTVLIVFIFPVLVTLGVYIKLLLFVRRLRRFVCVITLPTALLGKHELRMAKRVLMLLTILIIGPIPKIVFQSMKPPPDYQYRIYYLNLTIASFCCLLYLFTFTSQVRQRLIRWEKKIKTIISCRNQRTVAPQQNRY